MRRIHTPAVVALALLVTGVGVLGMVLSLSAPGGHDLPPVSRFIYLANPIVIGPLGGALLLRRPGHWAGRIMIVIALALDLDSVSKGVLQHHLEHQSWTGGLAPWAGWFDNWTWTVVFAGTVYTVLKFAGGTPHGRWLRAIGWVGIGAFGVVCVVTALARTNVDYAGVRTIVRGGIVEKQVQTIFSVVFLVGVTGLVCATAALIVHWRHATGAVRAQLRWLLWSFGSIVGFAFGQAGVLALLNLAHIHPVLLVDGLDALQELTVFTIPLAIFVSISRYGLFEIDRVVSRTVSYTLLIVVLGASYALIATSVARLVPDRFGSLPVAAATLAVVALFVPLRRRLLSVIERRFHRSRYDAGRVVAAFAEKVRRDGAEDPNGQDLLGAVRAALEPAHASVWLVPTSRRTS